MIQAIQFQFQEKKKVSSIIYGEAKTFDSEHFAGRQLVYIDLQQQRPNEDLNKEK